jgi:hypothetical protein
MIMQYFARYLKRIASIATIFLLLLAAFSYFIDPYRLYDVPLVEGLNVIKPKFESYSYLSKAKAIRVIKPTTILLGSSRSEIGMDVLHPALNGEKRYNLSLVGSTFNDVIRYYEYAHFIQPLQQVVIGLSMRQFEATETNPFYKDVLSVSGTGNPQWNFIADFFLILFSLDTFEDSIKTILKQQETQSHLLTGGFNPQWIAERAIAEGHRKAFQRSLKGYISLYDGIQIELDPYSRLLAKAHQNSVDLRLYICPSHAWQWELLSVMEQHEKWEEWKRQLVNLNVSVASQYEKAPFPLWDFSGYNSYTTEVIPGKGDVGTTMKWYWDGSHHINALGNLILDRIFNYTHPERTIADDFGVLLTTENIEQHLAQIRVDQEKWRALFPEDVAEIEGLSE